LATHPISKSFQAPKCVIKAKDPRLHQISVAAPSFLITGPIPEGILITDPIPKGIQKVALPLQYTTGEATSPHSAVKEEEEEEKKKRNGDLAQAPSFEDEFAIFNLLPSPEPQIGDSSHLPLVEVSNTQEDTTILEEMGI